jgi:hypothetical protein
LSSGLIALYSDTAVSAAKVLEEQAASIFRILLRNVKFLKGFVGQEWAQQQARELRSTGPITTYVA